MFVFNDRGSLFRKLEVTLIGLVAIKVIINPTQHLRSGRDDRDSTVAIGQRQTEMHFTEQQLQTVYRATMTQGLHCRTFPSALTGPSLSTGTLRLRITLTREVHLVLSRFPLKAEQSCSVHMGQDSTTSYGTSAIAPHFHSDCSVTHD